MCGGVKREMCVCVNDDEENGAHTPCVYIYITDALELKMLLSSYVCDALCMCVSVYPCVLGRAGLR